MESKGRHMIPVAGSVWAKAQLCVVSELLCVCDGGESQSAHVFSVSIVDNAKCVSEPKLLLRFERTAPVWCVLSAPGQRHKLESTL